jgi:hypothetical protein
LWDVAFDDVVNLLDFMYNGEVKVRHSNIQTFLALAGIITNYCSYSNVFTFLYVFMITFTAAIAILLNKICMLNVHNLR